MKHYAEGALPGAPSPSIGGIGSDRLTDRACKAGRPGPTARKLFDGKGLYLLVQPSGAKLWRLKYRHGGTERTYAIGAYDEVTLAEARVERDRARAWLREGKDPVGERRLERAGQVAKRTTTFEAIAREFIGLQDWSPAHRVAVEHRLEGELLPDLGRLPVDTITPQIVLAALKKIEARGALETASKCRVLASQVFRHAIVTGRLQVDPAAHLSGAMIARAPVNRATIPLDQMPALFAALAKVPAEANTKLALYWLVLTATRTSEMRFAAWAEIDAKAKLWRIPAARMKMRDPHVVPLSKQAIRVLDLARPLRRSDEADALIFPGFTRAGSLSENALLAMIARAGFYGRQTSHGFRAAFSTWAHETYEADPDVIEACLAHRRGDVRGIYNRSAYLSQRLALLQAWGDQLETWGMRP
jgi:integrase